MSVGGSHATILTTDKQLYCWGANSHGQLGLSNTQDVQVPTLNTCFESSGLPQTLSCGSNFTFLISDLNEIMVTGKLPFVVQAEESGEELDYITTF